MIKKPGYERIKNPNDSFKSYEKFIKNKIIKNKFKL